MIDQVKGAAAHTVKSMADINPFMGAMFAAFVGVLVWMAWQSGKALDRNQEIQDKLIELKVRDAEREREGLLRIDKLLQQNIELQKIFSDDRKFSEKRLKILETINAKLDACVADSKGR